MNSYRHDETLDPLIEVVGLQKVYHNGPQAIEVLHGINLKVYPGEMVAIMGPSGMGKSTFLFVLGLLHLPTSGEYKVKGEDVLKLNRVDQAKFRRKFAGFVFQSCNLFEHTTVYENLEYPLVYAGVERKMRPAMIHEALER